MDIKTYRDRLLNFLAYDIMISIILNGISTVLWLIARRAGDPSAWTLLFRMVQHCIFTVATLYFWKWPFTDAELRTQVFDWTRLLALLSIAAQIREVWNFLLNR